jgi:hypothetical protein
VKSTKFNLFSLTKRQKDSWLLNGDSERFGLQKGGIKLFLTFVLKPWRDICVISQTKGVEMNAAGPEQKVNKKAHKVLGHMNKDMCRLTFKALN